MECSRAWDCVPSPDSAPSRSSSCWWSSSSSILIIGILIAVAGLSFLAQAGKAQNSAVEQQLAVTRKEAKALWTSGSGYPTLCIAYPSGVCTDSPGASSVVGRFESAEPQYSFQGYQSATALQSASPAYGVIALAENDADSLIACELSKSNTHFCLQTNELGAENAFTGHPFDA